MSFAKVLNTEIIEHDPIGTGGNRFSELIQVFNFHFNSDMRVDLPGTDDCGGNRACCLDMIFLD